MRKICIIDDDNMYQVIVTRQIAKIDPNVAIVSYRNGAEALEGLKNIFAENAKMCDVIFLDINMPVMDGWEFLSNIETSFPEIGTTVDIYVVSTSLDARDKDRALANKNVKKYISKPIPTDILQKIVSGNY